MRNFFRHLKAAWYFGKRDRFVPIPNIDQFWTPADERSSFTYWNSTSGLKMKQMLTNKVIELAVSATQTKSDAQRDACGYASGARGIISFIEAHLSPVGAQSDTEAQQEEAVDDLERFAS